jgi:hypothetical protein
MVTNIYTPYVLNIIGVSNAQKAVITFESAHPYVLGEIISLRSSRPYGMYEINNMQGRVLSSTEFTITLDIDTTNFNTFVYPPVGTIEVPAQAVPSASGIIPDQIPATVTLQDAFDNVPTT